MNRILLLGHSSLSKLSVCRTVILRHVLWMKLSGEDVEHA